MRGEDDGMMERKRYDGIFRILSDLSVLLRSA